MKKLILAIVFVFVFCIFGYSQTPTPTPDLICITRAEAIKGLQIKDERDALKKESLEKDKAINDLKDIIKDLTVKLASETSANTELRNDKVEYRAIIQLLLQNTKARNKYGVINF